VRLHLRLCERLRVLGLLGTTSGVSLLLLQLLHTELRLLLKALLLLLLLALLLEILLLLLLSLQKLLLLLLLHA